MADEVNEPAKETRKIGEGHVAAMGRLGLKELRNAFTPSPESVADSEIGLYGSLTQGEIAEARGGPGGEQEKDTLADVQRAGEKIKENDGPDKSRGMER